MSYFLYPEKIYIGTPATLTKEEAAHLLLSRRVKVGEQVEIQDATPSRFLCVITQLGKKEVTFNPLSQIALPAAPKRNVHVYQALTAEQTLHVIIQKLTELGAQSLHIFPSKHSPGKFSDQKLPRWQRISLEAAKQSGRPLPLDIRLYPRPLTPHASTHAAVFLSQYAHDSLSALLSKTNTRTPIDLWIGPEGGWSPEETEKFTREKRATAHMGPYTLRAETAAIVATAIALNL